jgi:hypothetical protein
MAIKPQSPWIPIGTVRLRNEYAVERKADVYRVRSSTSRQAEFGQSIDGAIVRYLAKALSGRTVTVEEAQTVLRGSGLKLPYQYGYKLHFFAQSALVTLVASGNAAHSRSGRRFEYHIA